MGQVWTWCHHLHSGFIASVNDSVTWSQQLQGSLGKRGWQIAQAEEEMCDNQLAISVKADIFKKYFY